MRKIIVSKRTWPSETARLVEESARDRDEDAESAQTVAEPAAEWEETPTTEAPETELLRRLGKGNGDYYLGIRDKVDELFVVYPREDALCGVIPESEWVRINYDGDDYYVVGKLKDGDKVRYLGYGVPGVENVRPPKVADGIANWFPVRDLQGYEGYWLFFQDAETGRIER